MASETAELEQLVTPIDRIVVRYLQQNKNGVTIEDIINRIQSEVGETYGDVGQAVSKVLANAVEMGFVDKSNPDRTSTGEKPSRRRRRSRSRSRRRRRSRSRSRSRRRCQHCIKRRRVRPRGL